MGRRFLRAIADSRNDAKREVQPWLLMAPRHKLTARQLVTLYARRMQIELSFRDLKSYRYGQRLEDSLTRKAERIEVLLLSEICRRTPLRAFTLSGVRRWRQ
jgi:hypothetical protein